MVKIPGHTTRLSHDKRIPLAKARLRRADADDDMTPPDLNPINVEALASSKFDREMFDYENAMKRERER